MRLDGPAGDLRSNRLTLKRPTSYCHPNSHTCSLVFRFVRSPLLLGCMRAATHLASKKAVSPLAESSGMHLWCFPLVIGWRRLTTFCSKKKKAELVRSALYHRLEYCMALLSYVYNSIGRASEATRRDIVGVSHQ